MEERSCHPNERGEQIEGRSCTAYLSNGPLSFLIFNSTVYVWDSGYEKEKVLGTKGEHSIGSILNQSK